MKWIIFFGILCLVLLSGCLDLISTRQKQLCLSATHESQTSVFECNKTSECFKKVNSSGFYVSENLNYNIKNQILAYKNNVSSAIYYFNNSRDNLIKINGFCSGEKDVDIIKTINQLFFNLSKTFEYQDKSWQKSIELLKDYAIFLKENGIENISEEAIYDQYVLINQNLNELRGEENLSDNYISLLKIEAKRAQELAKRFGFTQSYMTEYGFVDLFAYYSEYVDNPKKELKLPLISKSSNYVFAKFSTIENFIKINESLSGADNYNLYILFDKQIGGSDSLFTKFVVLNNEINKEIDNAYNLIFELEDFVSDNLENLDDKEKLEFEKYKNRFHEKTLGFGYYLEKLKELALIIEYNKEATLKMETERAERIDECDIIIAEARKYNNNYFKEIIKIYEASVDYNRKMEICNTIRIALSNKDCLKDYNKLVELNFLSASENLSETECIDLLNQLNFDLDKDERIILIKKIILENDSLIRDLEKLDLDLSEEILLLNYKTENSGFKKENYKLALAFEENLNKLNALNQKINLLFATKIKNELKRGKIVFENGNYYLIVNNLTTRIGRYCFDTDLNLSELSSLDKRLEINKKEICIQIQTGINKYQISYRNQKQITLRAIELELENGLFEAVVKNTVVGVYDSLNLGQVVPLDSIKYIIDSNFNLWYFTEKENKILFYKMVFRKTDLGVNLVPNGIEYLIITRFKLKNLGADKICGKMTFIEECYGCVSLLKENNNLKNTLLEGGNLKAEVCFDSYQEKLFELQRAINLETAKEDLELLNFKLNKYAVCEFENIQKLAKVKILELEKYKGGFLSIDALISFYNLKQEIDNIEKQYIELVQTVENTDLILSKISTLILKENEIKEIEEIEKIKFKDPKKAKDKTTALYNSILNRIQSEENIYSTDFKNKINNLIENGKIAGVIDEKTQQQLNSLSFSESNLVEFKKIEEEINLKIKEKANHISEIITQIKNTDVKEIITAIDQVNYLYADVSLKELYEIKYYPPITLQDADRLNKKKEFLQTVSLNQNIIKFENNYQDQDYLKSIKSFGPDTIERLKDLNKELELIKTGLLQIKEDSNFEINKINKMYLKSNTEIKDSLLKINKNFENKKYLLVIKDSRKLSSPEKSKIKINYQLFILGGLMIAGIAGYLKINKKQKKLTKEEKKQRILRQY